MASNIYAFCDQFGPDGHGFGHRPPPLHHVGFHEHFASHSDGIAWFDGIGAALVGAIAAVFGVWWTLNNQARVRREEAHDRLVIAAVTRLGRASNFLTHEGPTSKFRKKFRIAIQTLSELTAGSIRIEPELRDFLIGGPMLEISRAARQIRESQDESQLEAAHAALEDALLHTRVVLSRWQADPNAIRYGTVSYQDVLTITATVDEFGYADGSFANSRPSVIDRVQRWLRNRSRDV